MENLHEFLEEDREMAEKEINCFLYLSDQVDKAFNKGQYAKALAFYNNAMRSLKELDRMKRIKQEYDEEKFLVAYYQIPAQALIDQQIRRMKS